MATTPISEALRHLRGAVNPHAGPDRTDADLLASFVEHHDEAAITSLIRRHGPMVWGVCRRVLGNPHDAEDAFQATFLVLVRRAASIASRKLLTGWLYGVALQTARKARAGAAKRRFRERQMEQMPDPEARQSPSHDIESLLDGEVSRLPELYRTVLILCDLEGLTRKEAAGRLGVPEGTVAARLTRARAMLAKRLLRRGLAPSSPTVAAIPASVLSSTIQSAMSAAGISPAADALTQEVLKAMWLSKLKTMTAVLLLAGVAALGMGLLPRPTAAQQSPAEKPSAKGDREEEAAARKRAEAIQQERKRFTGTWQWMGAEAQGKKATQKEIDEAVRAKIIHYAQNLGMKVPNTSGAKLVVVYDSEGKWKEQIVGRVTLTLSEGTSKINPAEKTKTVDQVITKRIGGEGYTRQGIYEFVNKDRWRVCFAEPGQGRPAGFTTRKDDGRIVWIFQRIQSERKAGSENEKP